ncbi:MAG: thymidylate synthase [Chromatiaceae bacterium]|nr:thymidylate synthase [Candidatus Thioaporhodococcus sediminis]
MLDYVSTFSRAFDQLVRRMLQDSIVLHPEHWQSTKVGHLPEAQMHELIHVTFQTLLPTRDLDHYRRDIEPNLPWADDHFEQERVSRHPINPGETWKRWPWGHSADKFRTAGEQFSHSYAERYWPKHANQTTGGFLDEQERPAHRGVRFAYGDLQDVVELLQRDPLTRQAYLPVWFPEDTGVVHGERVPCTLGYHWMMRNGQLHTYYAIRSCDILRHMRDDWYLTVRLTLWLLDQLGWEDVRPGLFTFWAGSLHCFVNDLRFLASRPSRGTDTASPVCAAPGSKSGKSVRGT